MPRDASLADLAAQSVQCEAHIAGTPPERRALAIFLRERGRWRLGVFAPASDP
jgi:hypothetical protein